MNHVFDEEEGEMRLEWEVEEILDSATIDGDLHYMVLWKGHLIEECTWETEANLANSRNAIDDFYVAFPKKRRGPGVPKKGKKSATKSDI
jgi:Chromo (CHRromatin Organisation MOdifier) domain